MKPGRTMASLMLSCIAIASPLCAASSPPTLKVLTLDGGAFDLAEQRGHWVIVNFWATWCSPCIKEMPDISAFVATHRDTVSAIGLAFEDTDKKDVVAFAKEHPVSYPLAQIDIYDPPADFAPPRSLPTTWLLAPDGRVAKKFVGPITSVDLEKAIAAAAAAK